VAFTPHRSFPWRIFVSFHLVSPSFFFFLPSPRRICLGLISASCCNHLLRERAGVGRTPHHKFPSCSKTNRVELIHSLSFFPGKECVFARIYTRPQYILSLRTICYWQRLLLTIALRQNIRIYWTDTLRTESLSVENVSSNKFYKKINMITQKFFCDILCDRKYSTYVNGLFVNIFTIFSVSLYKSPCSCI